MKKIKSPPAASGKFKQLPAAGVSTNKETPLFGLQYLDSTYSLKACTKDEKAAFGDTLDKLSKLSWGELLTAPRNGSGYEIIPQYQIRASIPNHVTSDIKLLAFRFCGQAPMVGYRVDRVFYVLWLDRDFTLYDHG